MDLRVSSPATPALLIKGGWKEVLNTLAKLPSCMDSEQRVRRRLALVLQQAALVLRLQEPALQRPEQRQVLLAQALVPELLSMPAPGFMQERAQTLGLEPLAQLAGELLRLEGRQHMAALAVLELRKGAPLWTQPQPQTYPATRLT